MEIAGVSGNVANKNYFETLLESILRLPCLVFKRAWEIGQEDPRRVIHALKVGLSITLVSLLYLLEPLCKTVGENAIWVAMAVVLVLLEFTAGATLCKGLNRGVGTLCAGLLAVLIEYIAHVDASQRTFRAIFIGVAVFIISFAATLIRFFPYVKKNYDYGVVTFLLTFNLMAVSSYRVHSALKLSRDQLYTIIISCGICLLMSLVFYPNWSGEDLHKSTVSKFEGLAKSIDACVKGYFQESENVEQEKASGEDPIRKGYQAVLDSDSSDETLAFQARWEPKYCYTYPWQQYVKLGSVLRHFSYTAVALHGCLQSEIQTPGPVRALFKEPCLRVAGEVSKSFMELADCIRNRRCCSPELLSENLQQALSDLNNSIKSQRRLFLGTNHTHAPNMLVVDEVETIQTPTTDPARTSLSSVKNIPPAFLKWRSTRVAADDQIETEQDSSARPASTNREHEGRVSRSTSIKVALTSFEFSEALPFAAFASLLVEMVVRLEDVITQVQELGTMANFKEFKTDQDVAITGKDREIVKDWNV